MQWTRLILPVVNQVVEFVARWRHLFYTFFNRPSPTDLTEERAGFATIWLLGLLVARGLSSFLLEIYDISMEQFFQNSPVWPTRRQTQIQIDLGVTLFVENWLALGEKWLRIDLSRLGVNKITWLDLELKQLKKLTWLRANTIHAYIYIII